MTAKVKFRKKSIVDAVMVVFENASRYNYPLTAGSVFFVNEAGHVQVGTKKDSSDPRLNYLFSVGDSDAAFAESVDKVSPKAAKAFYVDVEARVSAALERMSN